MLLDLEEYDLGFFLVLEAFMLIWTVLIVRFSGIFCSCVLNDIELSYDIDFDYFRTLNVGGLFQFFNFLCWFSFGLNEKPAGLSYLSAVDSIGCSFYFLEDASIDNTTDDLHDKLPLFDLLMTGLNVHSFSSLNSLIFLMVSNLFFFLSMRLINLIYSL